jgi:Ca2+-binding RTX toxin-like protein
MRRTVALALVASALALPVTVLGPPAAPVAGATCFGRPVTINLNDPDAPNPNRPRSDVVLGTPGEFGDTIVTGAGDDIVCAGQGDDDVFLGAGNDRVRAGAGYDSLSGGPGADVLIGDADPDTVDYRKAKRPITIDLAISGRPQSTGFGQDTLDGIENVVGALSYPNVLFGTNGGNVLYGGDMDDRIHGLGGSDGINGVRDGDDLLHGGDGNDSVTGGKGSAEVIGGNGNDILSGYLGADVLRGGEGRDHLTPDAFRPGGDGSDEPYLPTKAYGGAGDDRVIAGWNDDLLYGGPGVDLVSYYYANLPSVGIGVHVSLALTAPQDTGPAGIDQLVGFEEVHGTFFDDELVGDDGPNALFGFSGDDVIDGAGGIDKCRGFDGADVITNCETVDGRNAR